MPFNSQVASGKLDCVQIFENDYETQDATGSRDYIHVLNLANAHIKTLYCQKKLNQFEILNIGNGEGVTVFELIKSFQRVSGVPINYELSHRRDGDLPVFGPTLLQQLKN